MRPSRVASAAWVTGLQAAASDEDYRKALAGTFKSIVCAGNDDNIFALRGPGFRSEAQRA
jgi:hypothetical protein